MISENKHGRGVCGHEGWRRIEESHYRLSLPLTMQTNKKRSQRDLVFRSFDSSDHPSKIKKVF